MSDNGNGAALPEAGFSATVRIVNPANQFEWLVTTRAETAKDGLPRLALVEKWATDNGYLSLDAYVDQRKAERAAAAPANSNQPQNGNGHDDQDGRPPVCPIHNRVMKPSQHGGWYCTAKIAADDGTGKPVYCKHKVD